MKLNSDGIRLLWGTDIKSGSGNQFGYYNHNKNLREAVGRRVKLVGEEEDPTDILYIMSPEFFNRPDTTAKIWLFTMFEGNTIPDMYYRKMLQADCLLAPSTWVAELFRKYFPAKPVYVINHGVSKLFKYRKRWLPSGDKPFRFLWIGAPNPRKGYEEVIVVWKAVFYDRPQVELYVKSTGPSEWSKGGKVERNGNVILDGRKLTDRQLVKLYHSAHCFLFPTRGEGFGLTLAEAMRTGLPCVATHYSGVTDFFDERVGYVVKHKIGKGKVTFIGDDVEEETEMAFPVPEDLANKMMDIVINYGDAVRRAKAAHERIKRFTWDRAAITLLKALRKEGSVDD